LGIACCLPFNNRLPLASKSKTTQEHKAERKKEKRARMAIGCSSKPYNLRKGRRGEGGGKKREGENVFRFAGLYLFLVLRKFF